MQTNDNLTKHTQVLKSAMANLPLVTADVPGIGGEIKVSPEHFEVEEILPYSPCGEGEHVFVRLRRKLWNTADVADQLARVFGLRPVDVGWGGRKDKQAVTTQTFSLQLPMSMPMTDIRSRLGDLPFDILEIERHRNKIKTGHVAGNRFKIIVSQVPRSSVPDAEAVAAQIRQRGVPNFYGEQRFGNDGANITRALHMADSRRASRRKKDLFIVSALQSALFNLWLAQRMDRCQYDTIILGDVVQKTDTGGMFIVQDLNDALARFASGAIIYTGPMYGAKMRSAQAQAAEYEDQLLQQLDLSLEHFKSLKSPGTRRQAVLRLSDLTLSEHAMGLQFQFTLPPGAYATVVMREFLRTPKM